MNNLQNELIKIIIKYFAEVWGLNNESKNFRDIVFNAVEEIDNIAMDFGQHIYLQNNWEIDKNKIGGPSWNDELKKEIINLLERYNNENI